MKTVAVQSILLNAAAATTAEEFTAKHFTSAQIIALQRFEFALQQQCKPLPSAMLSLKGWLEAMLLASADPTPRSDWQEPPCGYADAAGEAVAGLQQNPET